MAFTAPLEITESLKQLEYLLSKQTTLKGEKRITALLRIKRGKDRTRQELADYLSISKRTLERWLTKYKTEGIEAYPNNRPKPKASKLITPIIHQGLSERVHCDSHPFLGYWDAQQWVNQTYGVEINYHRIREYMIQHFDTRVKRARKSHVKKDPAAQEAFLKLT